MYHCIPRSYHIAWYNLCLISTSGKKGKKKEGKNELHLLQSLLGIFFSRSPDFLNKNRKIFNWLPDLSAFNSVEQQGEGGDKNEQI